MKKCVTYLRLSKEDERIHDESNSIKNQRELIRKYIRENPELKEMEQAEFSDDGYSGKNMERPGMQELLGLIRQNKVGCIVVKDLSRFSRDYLEAGKYLERIFPFMGVRFISVNDRYDSKDYAGGIGGIDVAFKEILYDFYSVDLSEKVRSSLAVRKANGKYTANLPPYGYKKDPEQKGHLIPEPEAAAIMKQIFQEALAGESAYAIAKKLNADGVDPPGVYFKRMFGSRALCNGKRSSAWTGSVVARMLRNETYLGNIVFHKYEQPEVGSKKHKYVKQNDWKTIKGTHEPLISQEDFDRIVKLLDSRKPKKVNPPRPAHCLSTKVFCGCCGHAMPHGWNGRPKYYCTYEHYIPDMEHGKNSITDADLETAVLKALQKEIVVRADLEKAAEERKTVLRKKAAEAEKRLRDLEGSLEKLYTEQMDAFEDYKTGKVDREMFLQQKAEYDGRERNLQMKIRRQKEEKRGLGQDLDREGSRSDPDEEKLMADVLEAETLTREMVDVFVERITVWPGMKIEIAWKFREE